MYINKKLHILSKALMNTAIINIAGSALIGLYRITLAKKISALMPAMSDNATWYGQVVISILQVAATIVVFYRAFRVHNKYNSLIPAEDYAEMSRLQEEMNMENISTLSLYSIHQLLQIWAVILIGVRVVYDLSAITYRKMVLQLSQVVLTASLFGGVSLADVYNNSHGFKYIGMFTAVVLGTIMTAIFLKDRLLALISLGVTVFFMLAFVVMNMWSVSLLGMDVGIVWTSMIFHASETVGLVGLAYYLSSKYRGL